jgi:hypothetical protein
MENGGQTAVVAVQPASGQTSAGGRSAHPIRPFLRLYFLRLYFLRFFLFVFRFLGTRRARQTHKAEQQRAKARLARLSPFQSRKYRKGSRKLKQEIFLPSPFVITPGLARGCARWTHAPTRIRLRFCARFDP